MKKAKKVEPIKMKKLKIRGDEIAVLFFGLLFLIFLLISFFRLFAAGKLFDDFIFVFLFGWSKYLVYLILFALTIPICFNHYFKIRFSFILALSSSLIAISWLVDNINLIATSNSKIWIGLHPYSFTSFTNYFDDWWQSTIIKNYHGFFGHPLTFNNWTSVNSFFPSFAAGSIISNSLLVVTNYGTFIVNFLLNLLLVIISFSWLFFNKPWIFLATIFFFTKPLVNIFQKQKIKRISQKSIPKARVMQKTSPKIKETQIEKETEVVVKEIKPEPIVEDFKQPIIKPEKQQLLIQNVLKESGNLTPFGQVRKDSTQEIEIITDEIKEEV